jgi:hypothetical protein
MRTASQRILLAVVLLVSVPALASCGGGGSGGGSSEMVLLSFNHPNVAGVPLNEPLIFTFSAAVDPSSVTPDTIQVVGSPNFTFERVVVDTANADANPDCNHGDPLGIVVLLPTVPTFENYSDSGLQPGTTYTVFLPVFPAIDTIRAMDGSPLQIAEAFNFTTVPAPEFVEPRRALVHGAGRFDSPAGDEDGCVNNLGNEHFGDAPVFQFGTDECATALCLINENAPRILLQESIPTHDQRAVGTPSSTSPGTVDLGAIQIRVNEPVDPLTVVPWVPSTQLSLNVQLWRVGDNDGNPLSPQQVKTNKPVVTQDSLSSEIFLIPIGPQPQGIYVVNVQGVRDLPGNLIRTDDRPVQPATCVPTPVDDYEEIDCSLVGTVPPGYRIYFRTLQLAATSGSFTESFGNQFQEGLYKLFTRTNPGTLNPIEPIPGSPEEGSTAGFTLTNSEPGQATTANWNNAYKWLGISTAVVNTQQDTGGGRLKAVHQPYLGSGGDGSLTVTGNTTLSSAGGDANNDGIFEFENLTVNAGGVLTLTGPRPVQILCRGTVTINGIVEASGAEGRFGIDSDGTFLYTNAGAIERGGPGGAGGPGGGAGGHGGPANGGIPQNAVIGAAGKNLFNETQLGQGGAPGAFSDGSPGGGGGGGYGSSGSPGGGGASGGAATTDASFARALSAFVPDRTYQPNAALSGGGGGGGGGADDDSAGDGQSGDLSLTAADDGGGGGGGAGGGVWILADTIAVGGTGVIRADGGRGGNTYGLNDQTISDPAVDVDGDEFVSGVDDPTAAGTGEGGGGGGGAGGGVLLQARVSLTVASGATISAVGGAGGTSGQGNDGGAGGVGRVGLMAFPGATNSVSGTATVTPSPGAPATWNPTIDTISQGVSVWYDLTTSTADINPPFFDSNFGDLDAAGLDRGLGLDYEAILEFQAADALTPNKDTPTLAPSGITLWTPVATVTNGPPDDPIDMKRFFRWRWRFFAAPRDTTGTNTNPDFDPTIHPMPAILDMTIPYEK